VQYVSLGWGLDTLWNWKALGLLAFSQQLRVFHLLDVVVLYVNETNLKIGTSKSPPFEIE